MISSPAHAQAKPGNAPSSKEPAQQRPSELNRAWSHLATAAGPLQAKLTVNTPGDEHEQEADRVADQMLRMPDPEAAAVSGAAAPQVQRICPACEEEQKMQTKETPGATPEVGPETEARIGAMQGGGAPLTPALRGYFEPRLGQDLSAVRLHSGGQAEATAGEVQARAFTVGPNIAFAPGEFRPETESGKRLLAHELVHTVQQGAVAEVRRECAECEAASSGNTPDLEPAPFTTEETPARDGDSPSGPTFPVGEQSLAELTGEGRAGVEDSPIAPSRIIQRDPDLSPVPGFTRRRRTITRIRINLRTQHLSIEWSDGRTQAGIRISSGRGCPNREAPCSSGDNPYCTPTGDFSIYGLGGPDYRNQEGAAMSWYVGFESQRGIGIHDSQVVPEAGVPLSHGCVRVGPSDARLIHNHVTSRTRVVVRGNPRVAQWPRTSLSGYPRCQPRSGAPRRTRRRSE